MHTNYVHINLNSSRIVIQRVSPRPTETLHSVSRKYQQQRYRTPDIPTGTCHVSRLVVTNSVCPTNTNIKTTQCESNLLLPTGTHFINRDIYVLVRLFRVNVTRRGLLRIVL